MERMKIEATRRSDGSIYPLEQDSVKELTDKLSEIVEKRIVSEEIEVDIYKRAMRECMLELVVLYKFVAFEILVSLLSLLIFISAPMWVCFVLTVLFQCVYFIKPVYIMAATLALVPVLIIKYKWVRSTGYKLLNLFTGITYLYLRQVVFKHSDKNKPYSLDLNKAECILYIRQRLDRQYSDLNNKPALLTVLRYALSREVFYEDFDYQYFMRRF